MKLLIRDGEEVSSKLRDSRNPASETDMDMDSTPRGNMDEPSNPGPSTSFQNNRTTEHESKEGSSGNFSGGKKVSLYQPLSAGTAGPIRNTKAHARAQHSLATRMVGGTATTTPPPSMVKFPLTPNSSPGNTKVGQHDDQAPSPSLADMSQISNYNPSTTPALTAVPYLGDWTPLLPSAVETVYATPSTQGLPYSINPSMPTAHFDTYPFQADQRLGYHDNNEPLLYYSTGVGSWN